MFPRGEKKINKEFMSFSTSGPTGNIPLELKREMQDIYYKFIVPSLTRISRTQKRNASVFEEAARELGIKS